MLVVRSLENDVRSSPKVRFECKGNEFCTSWWAVARSEDNRYRTVLAFH
jgi:hypothetical protein